MKLFVIFVALVASASSQHSGGYSGGQEGGFQQFGVSGGNVVRNSFGGGPSISEGYSGGGGSSSFGNSNAGAGFGAFQGGNSGFSGQNNFGTTGNTESGTTGPQVFRHVFVHVAPEEPAPTEAKVIRVPGSGNKHVNIIFVKAPSTDNGQKTEVILPEQDQHKNLVYVLLKKSESEADIKIRKPEAKAPKKPEVYFIRYKSAAGDKAAATGSAQGQVSSFGDNSGSGYSGPVGQVGTSGGVAQAYGAPF